MRKVLFVGCGGSGGATLSYVMDQLRAELALHGINELPQGWQFLQIDVPATPDGRNQDVQDVFEQGGSYVSTAPDSGNYTMVDTAVTTKYENRSKLGELATWMPREPNKVGVSVADGAGQMRSVGRIITLSRLDRIYEGILRSISNMKRDDVDARMQEVSRAVPGIGSYQPNEKPLVIVVSSMSGGAGASMTLDVCRILANADTGTVVPGNTVVFMVSPGAFSELDPSAKGGVAPNALAVTGEIIAAQAGTSGVHDADVMNGFGATLKEDLKEPAPFARVFPIGNKIGSEGKLFGNGSLKAVYRGLGRSLAGLVLSDSALSGFISYTLANKSDVSAFNYDLFGWGSKEVNSLFWSSFGYASLSMGRDRYRHYAAQRISRFAVDRLLEGHLQPGNQAPATEQLNNLVESQWPVIVERLGFRGLNITGVPAEYMGAVAGRWLDHEGWVNRTGSEGFGQLISHLVVPVFNGAGDPRGVAGNEWIANINQLLSSPKYKGELEAKMNELSEQWAFNWSQEIYNRTISVLQVAVSQYGLRYAHGIVQRLKKMILDSKQYFIEAENFGIVETGRLGDAAQAYDSKRRISNGGVKDALQDNYRDAVLDRRLSQLGVNKAGKLLEEFVPGVLDGLEQSLSVAMEELEAQRVAPMSDKNLANVDTDKYIAWPCEMDAAVPPRFKTADNEVLVTNIDDFKEQFERDLITDARASEQRDVLAQEALTLASYKIILGHWQGQVQGEKKVVGLLEKMAEWNPQFFRYNPFDPNKKPMTPSKAVYKWHVSTRELVDRALWFVSRSNEPFEVFASESLREYALAEGMPDTERVNRARRLVDQFRTVLDLARPLVSVDANAVHRLHGVSVKYNYQYSRIPFAGVPGELMPELAAVVKQYPQISSLAFDRFESALSGSDGVSRIDVFGSYPQYSPLVYNAVLTPPAEEWNKLSDGNSQKAFWSYRRSRPLPAALPISEAERKAMIRGWYIGQLTGLLEIPEDPYEDVSRTRTRAVRVFDTVEKHAWVDFPNPMLTQHRDFKAPTADWLAAVLESVLLAFANVHHTNFESLRPYQVLRKIDDADANQPVADARDKHGVKLLADWLRTGNTVSGIPSRVTGDTLEARAEAANGYLDIVRNYVASKYLGVSYGGEAGGAFVDVHGREAASQTPILRDLAKDIVEAIDELRKYIDLGVEQAKRASAQQDDAQPVLPVIESSVAEPEINI